jgi:hypothetical protein
MAEGTKLAATNIFVEDDQDVADLIGFHLKRVTAWFRTATGVIAEVERRKPLCSGWV